jgi:hypothetical protein
VTFDGRWWWDGRQWLPAAPVGAVPPAPPGWNPAAVAGGRRMRKRTVWLISIAVILAGLGVGVLLLVAIAYALANAHY